MDRIGTDGTAGCPWDGWATGGTVEFCEARVCDWVVEPSNAWSNLAFIVVAIYLAWRVRGALGTRLVLIPPAVALMGVCSFAFHATGTWAGEVIDDCGMYVVAAIFISFALARHFSWSTRGTLALVAALSIVSAFMRVNMTVLGIPFFVVQLVAFAVLEIRLLRTRGGDPRYLRWLALTFAAAFGAWTLDATGLACNPENHVVTGHALWHVGTAACLWLYYEYQEPFTPG